MSNPPVRAALAIVGTDTGVGKTLVGRALARHLRRTGHTVRVLKPAESGCRRDPNGQLVPEDALALAHAANDDSPLDSICPYRYEAPVAPGVAAMTEGNGPALEPVRALIAEARSRADVVLVEGAGGLMVPFAPMSAAPLWVDWLTALELPVLIVARAALGTINHTLLTLEALARRGIPCRGVVLNQLSADVTPDSPTNGSQIERHGGHRVLGIMPYLSMERRQDDEALAELAAEQLALRDLWSGRY